MRTPWPLSPRHRAAVDTDHIQTAATARLIQPGARQIVTQAFRTSGSLGLLADSQFDEMPTRNRPFRYASKGRRVLGQTIIIDATHFSGVNERLPP